MPDDLKRKETIKKLLNKKEISEEIELAIDELLEEKLSEIGNIKDKNLTIGEKLADNFARLAGSWTFIIIFCLILICWIIINIIGYTKFDPYPFILLNLVLSCVAAIQAPIIMMSQNRSEEKDRARSENEYKINLKSEILLEDIHYRLEKIVENQNQIKKILNKK